MSTSVEDASGDRSRRGPDPDDAAGGRTRAPPDGSGRDTASEAMGRRARRVGLVATVAVHVLLAALVSFPRPEPPSGDGDRTVLREVELPPKVRVPPAPPPIRQPPPPQARHVQVDADVTTAAAPVPAPPSGAAPSPPDVSPVAPGERPSLAQADVPPLMEAPDELRDRLRSRYPERLEELRRGGVVELRFFVDRTGEVDRVEVAESSGHGRLDRTAADITREVTFLPAMIRDRPVGIWVSQRICFVFVEDPDDRPTPEECERRVALGGQ